MSSIKPEVMFFGTLRALESWRGCSLLSWAYRREARGGNLLLKGWQSVVVALNATRARITTSSTE